MTAPAENHDNILSEKVSSHDAESYRTVAILLTASGLIALITCLIIDPKRAFANMLVDGVYFVGVPMGSAVFLALTRLTGARWSEALRRVADAIMAFLPVASLLLIGVLFGIGDLYHWSDADAVHHSALLAGKAVWLNSGFFALRMLLVLGLWNVLVALIRGHSLGGENPASSRFSAGLSAVFIVILAPTLSLASFDWLMSVEQNWYSTIYGLYVFCGWFVSGLAVISVTVSLLKGRGYLTAVNENHLHDLGKLMFAFSMFWAYLWFCQFMLIWYGNIPEETVYFAARFRNDWIWLFLTNLFLNFFVPFFVLLPRASKRSPAVLLRGAVVLLIGHWLDLCLMVFPGVFDHVVSIGPAEIFIALGYAGLLIYMVTGALSHRSLLPPKSPALAESLHYHQ